MNIAQGPTKEEHCYLTTAGARYYVRLFMDNRQTLKDAGHLIPSPCVITWLGRDDGFAADLAMMAVGENRKGCILSDPLNAAMMPIGAIVLIPCLTEETVREWISYRNRRYMATGEARDSIVYAVAGYYQHEQLSQFVCSYVDGPSFKVHCEWIPKN